MENKKLFKALGTLAYICQGVLTWGIVATLLAFWCDIQTPHILGYSLGFALLLGAGGYFVPIVRYLVPLWGEYIRGKRVFARRLANEWLRETGLIPRTSDENYRAYMLSRNGNMTLEVTGAPIADADLQRKARDYLGNYSAQRFHYKRKGKKVSITWLAFDPLDQEFTSPDPPQVETDTMAVYCMKDDNGDIVPLEFREVSGLVVSGVPASGKSVSMRVPFSSLDALPEVNLTVLDCKGASDWNGLNDVRRFSFDASEVENLHEATQVIDEVINEMNARYANGINQYWNLPTDKRPAFRVLVIDESQELFEASPDPAVKKARASLLPKVTALVKKGRSAGICVALLSQKQTSDAIPTALRDNATLKIAFRLSTREAVASALGRASENDEANPLDIPRHRRGGAVIELDGKRKHVRFMTLAHDAVAVRR